MSPERAAKYLMPAVVVSTEAPQTERWRMKCVWGRECPRPIAALSFENATVPRPDCAEATLFALARAVELRDRDTAGHGERLAMMSLELGLAMGLSTDQLITLFRGGYLHDIGKVGLPDAVLLKTGPLTDPEWDVMRRHPAMGEEICRPLASLAPVLPIIRSHHEKWDGTGYPDGLKGTRIPLLARIVQMADIYDALTSYRHYKTALPPERALRVMEMEAERGWRDPQLMAVFSRVRQRGRSRSFDISLENLRQRLAGYSGNTIEST